ncbi:SCO6880 family protein [Actinokineospora enzanensis]|uniref:SCO6880 family protein n=1 Tax=Actinokineospora enzanensis TaxID=155975 RepID=UPI000373407B|nr:SCO6880 family protein [Actinokineospora enzanensis]
MSNTRMYGGWRPRRGFGVGKLTEAQTAVTAACVFVPLGVWVVITTFGLSLLVMPVAIGIAVVVALLTLIPHRTHGTSLGGAAVIWMRTRTARRKGWTEWETGVFTRHPRKNELPGVLAPIVPLSTQDGLGQPYGLLWDRRTGRLTSSVRVAPVGTVLADQDRTDLWIGSFAAWQAALGYEPTIEWVAIVVESAPSSGTELADYVADRLDPNAPQVARDTMTEVAESHRGSTADISVRVNMTFQPMRARPAPQDDAERVAEVSRAMAGLEGDLPLCGVASLGRATAATMTHWLRSAYDPDARSELGRLSEQNHLLAWSDAGPVRAEALVDHYWHDSGWSVSWAMSGLPNQNVTSNILAPLVTPGRYHRRVCITYQPFPADQAGDVVTREASGSSFRRQLRRRRGVDDTARDRADEARAIQAAEEEAQGSGVGLWAMYVTTTVEDPRKLPDAIADVESRARNAKLRLRRCWGWQHAGFAASLGVGVYPPELMKRGRWAR